MDKAHDILAECRICGEKFHEEDGHYIDDMFYCKDHFEHLETMSTMFDEKGTRLAFLLSTYAKRRMTNKESVKMAISLLDQVLADSDNEHLQRLLRTVLEDYLEDIKDRWYL